MSFIDAAKLAAGRKLGRALLVGRKYSPEVLTVVGVVGVVAAVALTVRSTIKLEETLDKTEREIFSVKNFKYDNDKDRQKALVKAYAHRGVDLVKLYGPPVFALTVGVGSILCANGILRKRNLAAMAAYRVVKSEYDSFRKNVEDELGEEKARDLRLGLTEERTVDFETGKEIVVKKSDPNRHSQYARFFDDGNPNFNSHWREGNLQFLLGQQKFANQRLHAKGWLTLNDVYEALGLPETPDGAVVGWVDNSDGDGYVDFGIFDLESTEARNFVNGYEPHILLDFNVDGFIQDHIGFGRR